MAIWSKGDDQTDALVHEFTVGDDWRYDRVLARYDLLGCIAHARMLGRSDIIADADADALVAELQRLHAEYRDGAWQVEASDEDVHSKIEALLIERLGDAGKRLHTGRSRNDQVLTAMRLWLKDELCTLARTVAEFAQALLDQARTHEFVPLPGYTHLQRGMPSSCGMFFGAHAAALLDDLILFDAAFELADSNPLGSGASYGVGLALDRAYVADLLGFARPGGLALQDANSRGKIECAALDAAGAVVGDCSRLASDVVFFVSQECGFFTLERGFTTGSSIMPQKQNPDLFELMRGRAARFLGLRSGLYALTLGLSSGYSRDLQDSKAMLIDGIGLALGNCAIGARAIPALQPQRERIEAALSPELYATDEAYKLVRESGLSFRDAYQQVGRSLDALSTPDHEAVLRSRSHLGSTGNLGLGLLGERLDSAAGIWRKRQSDLHATWQALL